MLDSTVTRWTSISGNKRAIVSRGDVAGVLYDAGAKYGVYVEIARPDRELVWELDPQERSYRELTAEQFTRLLQKGIQAPRVPEEQPLRTLYRSETTAIEVVPTGRTKRIAGFAAEEVLARVVVGAQNLISGNRYVFTFDQDIWITRDERLLKEIQPFEEAYAEAFGSAATLAQARLLAGEWSDAFTTHLRAVNDRVRALKGFPLSCTTSVTEESIAQSKNEKGTSRKKSVASCEVRKITVESIPDAEFELPAGYINSDTKVAVAPAPGTAVVQNDPPVPPARADPPVITARTEPPPAPRPAPAVKPEPAPAVAASKPSTPTSVVTAPTSVVTAPPTNVVVRGANNSEGGFKPKSAPVLVQGYVPPPIRNNYPVLGSSGPARAGRIPPPITIDEPEDAYGKKRKKR